MIKVLPNLVPDLPLPAQNERKCQQAQWKNPLKGLKLHSKPD
jgi:hypothetical protein